MGKHPQNRFHRLAIVCRNDNKQQSAWSRWWGPPRIGDRQEIHGETQATKEKFKSLSMAVMPTFSRGLWLEAIAWTRSFLRDYFVARKGPQRGVVLSFHRHAGLAPGFMGKKANGSVRWSSDREVAPQEGGRG